MVISVNSLGNAVEAPVLL